MRKKTKQRRVKKPRVNKRRTVKSGRSDSGTRFFSARGVMFGLMLAATVFLGRWFYTELLETERLNIVTVEIRGARVVSEGEVLELAGIYRGMNILSVSSKEVAGALETHPYIESARVEKRFPDTVSLVVVERKPLALVNVEGAGLVVMDRKGVLFKKYTPSDGLLESEGTLDLPVITGLEAFGEDWRFVMKPKLLPLMAELGIDSTLGTDNISEINYDHQYGFTVITLDSGIKFELGKDGFREKIANLQRVLEARGGDLRGVENVDLNDGRGVVVRFTAT